MSLFRRFTDADPRFVTILPYRDLRAQEHIDGLLQKEFDRRVSARRTRGDRRKGYGNPAVDLIAVEYAEMLAPNYFARQAG